MSTGYARTWQDGGTSTHLVWHGRDNTICGLDIVGDPAIHDKPPLTDIPRCRVSCPHCQQVIATVKEHLNLP